jgi:hypothetical protein
VPFIFDATVFPNLHPRFKSNDLREGTRPIELPRSWDVDDRLSALAEEKAGLVEKK